MARKDDIKALLTQHQHRLQKRKEQQARFGINTPPEILTEIEDIEAEIQRYQIELEALDDSGEEKKVTDLDISRYSAPSQRVDQIPSQNIRNSGNTTIKVEFTGNNSGQLAVGKNIVQEDKGFLQFWKGIFSRRN